MDTHGKSEQPADIVVTGDVAIDWLEATLPEDGSGRQPPGGNCPAPHDLTCNWRLHPRVVRTARPGGATLLADLIRQFSSARVAGPEFMVEDLGRLRQQEILLSEISLKHVKGSGYRLDAYRGFRGRCGADAPTCMTRPDTIVRFPSSAEGAKLVVIDDSANSFRYQEGLWPAGIQDQLVVYKMHHPLAGGPHWQKATALQDRLVTVIQADDLRRYEGVNISRAISWERTAADLIWQIRLNPTLAPLSRCSYLVVLLGGEGAILYRGLEEAHNTLLFNPTLLEGGCPVKPLYARGAIFTAALARELLRGGIDAIEDGIRSGLELVGQSQDVLFHLEDERIVYPIQDLWPLAEKAKAKGVIQAAEVPPPDRLTESDPDFWRILDYKTRNTAMLLAEEFVRTGSARALRGIPIGQFGKLRIIDRAEIEAYSGIRNLIAEFLHAPKSVRPLSIAVFGSPGSGKSFGVTEVAKSVGQLTRMDFNVSQFRNVADLIQAFHQIRDALVEGAVPFVFFDEFDSSPPRENLGWLKLFLAPMQDGKFRDGDTEHLLGRAVFVFAGGTSSSYAEFARLGAPAERQADFAGAKGPDFLSRLRGHIDIKGPDPRDAGDRTYVIRRAMLLRGMLERMDKARHLFDRPDNDKDKGTLHIDDGVLRALLRIPHYRHGVRSIEAILDMSMLAGRTRFGPEALPHREQLEMHVHSEDFMFLATKERFTAGCRAENELVEKIATCVSESYRRERELEGNAQAAAPAPTSGDLWNSNLDAAADIPAKLRSIGCGVRPIPGFVPPPSAVCLGVSAGEGNSTPKQTTCLGVARSPGRPPNTPDITDDEVELLARKEHERWCRERMLQGWRLGEVKNTALRTTPYLVDFDRLPPNVQDFDRKAVLDIPVNLASCGWEIYRMQETQSLSEERMIDLLARLQHARYVEERKAEGDTAATNPALVDFEDLSEDLRQSNQDYARTIPAKLLRAGYAIRRLRKGKAPQVREFTAEQVETMARKEHERWNWQRRLLGWRYKAGDKDIQNKTTPYLVPYDQLPEKIKEYDRQPVRLIPELLEKAGYEACKIKLNVS